RPAAPHHSEQAYREYFVSHSSTGGRYDRAPPAASTGGALGVHQLAPTSKRAKRVTVTPASSSSALTVFFESVTDGCSSSTTSLTKPLTLPQAVFGSAA